MIQAVTHSPRYVEGSAPTGFMQSIRDLIAKVQEIVMGILEKLLPCFFQKEETANSVALNPTENSPVTTGQGLLEQQAAIPQPDASRPALTHPPIDLNQLPVVRGPGNIVVDFPGLLQAGIPEPRVSRPAMSHPAIALNQPLPIGAGNLPRL
jgi:hypothetical protein